MTERKLTRRQQLRHRWRMSRQRSFVRWWPLHFKVVTFVAFASLGLNAWVFSQVADLGSKNAARIRDETHDRRAAVAANIRARYDDCIEGNALRHGNILIAKQQQLPDSVIRKLFPNIPDSLIRKSHATFRLELQLFAPRNCLAYAREALPKDR